MARKSTKTPVLITVEGTTEKAFIDYLIDLFQRGGCNFDVKNAQGGSPNTIVESAIRNIETGYYIEKYVIIDGDIGFTKKVLNQIKKHKIELIITCPTFEALFLEILETDFSIDKYNTSKKCKKEFEKYLKGLSKTSSKTYYKILPKKLLNTKKCCVRNLEKIIRILSR